MAGRPRSAEKDDALRQAGLLTFVERGWTGFTLDEVARRSGVSRSALYRRWTDRETLLLDALGAWRSTYDVAPDDSVGIPLERLIDRLIEGAERALRDPFTRALLSRLLTLGPDGHAILKQHLATIVARRRAVLTRAIRDAQRDGDVRPDLDPDIAQDAVAGALAYSLVTGRLEASAFDVAEYLKSLFRLVGLSPHR